MVIVLFFIGCTLTNIRYPFTKIEACNDFDNYGGGTGCSDYFESDNMIYIIINYEYTQPFNITGVLLIDDEVSSINDIRIVHEEEGNHWRAEPLYNKNGLPPGEYTYIITMEDYEKARVSFEVA